MILATGVNVIFTSLGIDDVAQKYLVEAGCIGVRRVDKADLRRIARASCAKIVTTLSNEDGTESFDKENVGNAKKVWENTVGDMDYIFIEVICY